MRLFRYNLKDAQIPDNELLEDVEDLFKPIIDAEAVQAKKTHDELVRRRCALLHSSDIIVAS